MCLKYLFGCCVDCLKTVIIQIAVALLFLALLCYAVYSIYSIYLIPLT